VAPTEPQRVPAAVPVLAALLAAAHLASAALAGFGFHRTEFALLAAGRRLAAGYVDVLPLAPWLARLGSTLFGDSALGVRVLPALAAAGSLLVTARLARQLGGGRSASVLAALALVSSPGVLVRQGLLCSSAFSLLLVPLLASLVLELLHAPAAGRTARRVGWVAGACLLSHLGAPLFVAGLLLGLLLSAPGRALLAGNALRIGLPCALLLLPWLVWQVQHGLPTWDFVRAEHLLARSGLTAMELLGGLLQLANPCTLPLLLAGAGCLLDARVDAAARRALLGLVLLPLALLIVSQSGRPDRWLAALPVVFAAGAGAIERACQRLRQERLGTLLVGSCLLAGTIWLAPLGLPALPPELLARHAQRVDAFGLREALSANALDRLGWPALVEQVARRVDGLRPEERRDAVLLALNSGEAGALELLGQGRDLPPVYCAQNSASLWPPPPGAGRLALSVGWPLYRLRALYAEIEEAGRIDNPIGLPRERTVLLHLAREPRVPLAEAWPGLAVLEADSTLD